MTAEKTAWLARAQCAGATELFYERVWPKGEDHPIDREGLEYARDVCAGCPVRRLCLELVMTQEKGLAAANRFGVAAGMTPAQRWSLEKRAAMSCEACGRTLDPNDLIHGRYSCVCGQNRTVAPIPDDGDKWSRRHTTLARRAIAFLVDGSTPGVLLPSPTALADDWGIHKADMTRVYRELAEDSMIVRNETDTAWVVTGAGTTGKEWVPRHLR